MIDKKKFYIDGSWRDARDRREWEVINPATELPVARIALADRNDLDLAVAAARKAFADYSMTRVSQRLEYLQALREIYKRRQSEIAEAITLEMGAPTRLAKRSQTGAGRSHIRTTIRTLRKFAWAQPNRDGKTLIAYEPIGVCGLITPWNWPMNQITAKVVPALAAGCTVVLKPSELAPLSAMLFAEIVDEAGFPPGVFNLVNGDGANTGAALAGHPGIDMVSVTGSTQTGRAVSIAAADTIKRVTLELGGKSPLLILADADLERAVKKCVNSCFVNSGQSCNAATRMLVDASVYERVVDLVRARAESARVGDPTDSGSRLGPLVSADQYAKVQALIESGIAEGATPLVGGPGKPDGFERGYYARPTVFTDVTPGMRIWREEIFGPVLCLMPFSDEEQALELANDTPYGLCAYLHTADLDRAQRVTRRLQAGMVRINGASHSSDAPFGGFKQSGNGRELGEHGLREFLEVKSISGLKG